MRAAAWNPRRIPRSVPPPAGNESCSRDLSGQGGHFHWPPAPKADPAQGEEVLSNDNATHTRQDTKRPTGTGTAGGTLGAAGSRRLRHASSTWKRRWKGFKTPSIAS